MTFLRRLWLAIRGQSIPNPREQHLRHSARRLDVVAHLQARSLRDDYVRGDYQRYDDRIGQ